MPLHCWPARYRKDSGELAPLFVSPSTFVCLTLMIYLLLQCVRSVISDLQRNLATKRSSGFDFVTLNGMEMRDPFESYSKLWQELKVDDARCSTSSAEKRLESFFSGKQGNERERVTVVLLDEIDYLVTKNQSVLFNFFDWPSRSRENNSKKRLVVIGISNTLNLPERLQPRVQSRIGSKRVFFQSYSVKETVEILNSKMLEASPNYAVFDPDAVLYASKKTASLSGDIRKAFQICRSAAEMVLQETNEPAETTTNPKVGIKDVLKVSREATNAAQSRFVGLCAPFEVLLLIALSSLSKTTGRECGGFDVEEIITKMDAIANNKGDELYLPPPSLQETLGILSRLRGINLVSLDTCRATSLSLKASLVGSGGPWPLVSTALDDLGLLLALKETAHYSMAAAFLSRS